MSLGSPHVERATRRLVRQEVRASREMKRERRQILKNRRMSPIWSLFVFICILSGVSLKVTMGAASDAILVGLVLFGTGGAFVLVQSLLRRLYSSQDLGILAHHPMSDSDFFSFQWKKSLAAPLVLCPFFLVLCGVLVSRTKISGGAPWLALVGAVGLQVGVLVAGTLALRLLYHWWWKAWLVGWILILAGAGVVFSSFIPGVKGVGGTWFLDVLLPTGWAAGALHYAVLEGRPEGWILAALAGAFSLAIPWLLARVRATYWLPEVQLAGAGVADSAVAQEMAREAAAWAGGARPTEEDRVAARESFDARQEDLVRSREFLAPLDWARLGWIERAAAFLMSRRQKLVAEFLTGRSPGWTRSWKRAVLLTSLGIVALAITRNVRGLEFLVLLTAVALCSGIGLPGFGWHGFRLAPFGMISSPAFGHLPISLKEMIVVIAKVHLVRCAAMLVPAAALGAVSAIVYRMDGVRGAGLGIYLVLLLVAVMPAAITARFLDLSRDGSRFRLQSLWVLPGALILVVAVPVSLIAPFVKGSEIGGALGLAVAGAASLLVAAVGWGLFRWGRRDYLRWYQPNSM